MNFGKIIDRDLIVFSAITDILRIFADTEIGGQYEFDYEKIANYLDSPKVHNDYWGCKTKEEIYQRFTEDIYNGYPVWQMLKLSPWTAKMVEKSFTDFCEQLYNDSCKKYKCLTCKFYLVIDTSLGPLDKCVYREEQLKLNNSKRMTGREKHFDSYRESFTLKEQCDFYEQKVT